jgi:hypothetical protein
MEHFHNNLMKLGGSLGILLYFTRYFLTHSINCTLENGLTVRNISSFYNKFFIFCGTLPSDPPNFIKSLNYSFVLFCFFSRCKAGNRNEHTDGVG